MTNVARRIGLAVAILGIMAGAAEKASAGPTVTFYTSESSFLAATSDATVINFEGIVPDNSFGSILDTQLIGGVTFTSSGGLYVAGPNAPTSGSPYESAVLNTDLNAPITSDLTSVGTNFTAVGGAFDSLLEPGSTETLVLTGTTGVLDTETVTTGTLGAGGPLDFFGWTVSGDTVVSVTSSQPNPFAGLDNFTYGFAMNAVPEPSSIVSAGIACLTGMGYFWRRRKANLAA
jgi:hypothetical protein